MVFIHGFSLALQYRQYYFPVAVNMIRPQINLGTTVTMTSNGRQAAEGQAQPPQAGGQPDQPGQGQAPPPQQYGVNQQAGQGAPRVIRITHQTMEPVVMMQMNIDGELLSFIYIYFFILPHSKREKTLSDNSLDYFTSSSLNPLCDLGF